MKASTQRLLSSQDQLDIVQCVTGMGFFADVHEWDRLAECYDTSVRIDYTSLIGGEPSTLDRQSLIAFFRKSLDQWDATQHFITNVQITQVTRDEVQTRAHERAVQVLNGRVWIIGAYFTHGLRRTAEGWRIFSQKLTPMYEIDRDSVKAQWLARLG